MILLSQIFIRLDFDPKTQNFDFSKINGYKIQKFGVIPKNWNVYCKATYKQRTCKISEQYLYIWLCNGQKPGKGDDFTFLNSFCWHF